MRSPDDIQDHLQDDGQDGSQADVREAVAELHRLVRSARSIACLTGAGISTESGIPDFRSPGSPWLRNRPIPFDDFLRSEEARREAWRRKFAMDDLYRGARPGPGHRALARLVRQGRMAAVVTQNIDGLHQESGLAEHEIVELHGNGTYAACLSCHRRHELDDIRPGFDRTGEAPLCVACGGIVKSATISFGQAMPERAMRRAQELAEGSDLYLAIGSSLQVHPAASLPVRARRAGARLVILNREPTPLDEIAALVVRSEIGPALAPFAAMD